MIRGKKLALTRWRRPWQLQQPMPAADSPSAVFLTCCKGKGSYQRHWSDNCSTSPQQPKVLTAHLVSSVLCYCISRILSCCSDIANA